MGWRVSIFTAAGAVLVALGLVPGAAVGAAPNDTYYPLSWHHQVIGSEGAWEISGGSRDVIVAVIDTGVDANHPDLVGHLVSGWNFTNNSADTSPIGYHGTTVAGVIAASRNNGIGVAGVADVSIMPIIASDSPTSMTDLDAVAGIHWAADHGAKVINISAGLLQGPRLGEAAQYAWGKGALVVVAGKNTNGYGNHDVWDEVISVSASGRNDTRYNSEYGEFLDLLAPGQDIYTTYWEASGEHLYAIGQGASYAAPMVSAAAALAWSINPELTNAQVREILFSTAVDLGDVGWDEQNGWGRLNLAGVAAAAASVPEPGVMIVVVANAMMLGRRGGRRAGRLSALRGQEHGHLSTAAHATPDEENGCENK
jgi:subtilisin family serine protease